MGKRRSPRFEQKPHLVAITDILCGELGNERAAPFPFSHHPPLLKDMKRLANGILGHTKSARELRLQEALTGTQIAAHDRPEYQLCQPFRYAALREGSLHSSPPGNIDN